MERKQAGILTNWRAHREKDVRTSKKKKANKQHSQTKECPRRDKSGHANERNELRGTH
jgi:hypothetical protein